MGTQKLMVYNGKWMFDLYMGDFGGTSILGNLHIYIFINTY